MLKKITASLLALALATSPALAGSSTIAVTPGSGATYQVITNGSGNFVGMFGLCDGVAAAQCVAVKAASTAAVATDPALVVAISPNNTVGVTGTFWQTTQPVSGTFWQTTQPISAVSLPLPTGAALEAGGNLATTATNTGTLAGAVTSSVVQSNTKQVNGVPTLTGAGATGTGSQRMTVAQDTTTIAGSPTTSPLLTNPGTAANWGILADNAAWTASTTPQAAIGCEFTSGGATALTTGHVGTPGCTSARGLFADLESVGGTALGAIISNLGTPASGTPATLNLNNYMVGCASTVCNPNGQTTASASAPVVLPSNQSVADPCMFQAKTKVPFSTTSGSTQLVALSGSTKIYVCAVHFISTAADSISFVEGTGTACATSATAVSGSTTAASGMDFAANGGMTEGSGVGTVMSTSVAGDELCLLQSGTTKVAGNLEVVQQ